MEKSESHLENPKNNEKFFRILLFIIVLVGAGLRFFQLGYESLWLDEAASGLRARMSWTEMFSVLTELKANPPLHYILLKAWADVFGHSEFSLRFMSAVFSILSIVLFYHIVKLLFSERVGLLATTILALSRFHIDFAQEARCYALMGFLVLLSMYYMIRICRAPTWGLYAGYIIASVAMLYNHYYAPFVIIMQNLYILTVYLYQRPISRKQIMYWFAGQGLIGLCYIPWIGILRQAVKKIETVPTVLQAPGLVNVLACFKAFSGGKMWMSIFLLALACLSLYGITRINTNTANAKTAKNHPAKNNIKPFYLTLLWLAVPMALPFLYSVFRAPIFSSRYTLISSYPFYLLIAFGVSSLQTKTVRCVLIGITLLVSARVLLPRYFYHNNEEWRQATAYLESKAKPGHALLFHAPFCGNVGYAFYAERTDLSVLGFPRNGKSGYVVTASNIEEIPQLLEGYTHIWLILSHSRDTQGLILEKMRKDYSQADHASFNGIEIYLFNETSSSLIFAD